MGEGCVDHGERVFESFKSVKGSLSGGRRFPYIYPSFRHFRQEGLTISDDAWKRPPGRPNPLMVFDEHQVLVFMVIAGGMDAAL